MLAAVGIAATIDSGGSPGTANASSAQGARETQAGTRTTAPAAPPVAGAQPISVAAVGDTVMGSPPTACHPTAVARSSAASTTS